MPKQELDGHELTRGGLTTDGSFTAAIMTSLGEIRRLEATVHENADQWGWNEGLTERRSEGSAQFKGVGCASHQFWLTSNTAAVGYFAIKSVVAQAGATTLLGAFIFRRSSKTQLTCFLV
jgi:hypothetical protein